MKTILVRTALMAKETQALLEHYDKDSVSYTFLSKRGIDMEFEVVCNDVDDIVAYTKSIIKGTDFGKALYFSVVLK